MHSILQTASDLCHCLSYRKLQSFCHLIHNLLHSRCDLPLNRCSYGSRIRGNRAFHIRTERVCDLLFQTVRVYDSFHPVRQSLPSVFRF